MQSGCQQHEPTEASKQNTANRSRNSLRSRREGCQGRENADGIMGNVEATIIYTPANKSLSPRLFA